VILLRYLLILALPVLAYIGLRKVALRYALTQRQFNGLLVLTAILLVVVILIVLGRIPPTFIIAPIMVALTFMLRNVHLFLRLLPLLQMFRSRTARSAYGTAGETGSSSIRTRYLLMELQHSSGDMDGDVLEGEFKGARLSTLTLAQLLVLAAECAEDTDSLQILEAYLDRTHPQWRSEAGSAGSGSSSAAMPRESTMTEALALEILGLQQGADRESVIQAHRRLMQRMHPDRGGSDYLAKKINEARDFLLAKL
jgi:hypothetical protein